MPVSRRHHRTSSSESSDASSSSSDDDYVPSTAFPRTTATELTLKDDEDTIAFQRALPEDYGESDDDRRLASRAIGSSVSEIIEDERKQELAKKKRKRIYFICVSMCKYECVRRAAKRLNFREVSDEDDWNIYWTDTSVGIERVAQMKKWQKINHFPGMSEICRKDSLTRNMSRMMKMFPKEYAFYPKAWCLPADYNDFSKYCADKKSRTFISKPDVGCQGRGIFITKNPAKDIKSTDNFVVQVYVNRPFLIDGYKFDFRVYVAVTSCDPFRIFVYKDGLARFTTQHYEEPSQSNCKDIFMHLTNYAIQKRSDDFIRDEDTGTKRRITTINRWLVEHGYDIVKLWEDIDDVIIKVLISAHSILKHNYRACFPHHYRGSACFEILGFDILIDRKLKPYVLEVNHSPSFTTDSRLDREIKDALIYDTLLLLNMPSADKRRFVEEEKKRAKERLFQRANKKDNKFREEQEDLAQQWQKEIHVWEDQHIGNYRRIYPLDEASEKYEQFFLQSGTLYSETTASKARIEQAKAQIDELQKKQDKLNTMKTSKAMQNAREAFGESPTKKALPFIKSSRSSSFNQTSSKRLPVNLAASLPVYNPYGETFKPVEIDENEELERMLSLKNRETLVRGMGVVDICHRMLFGTAGTAANLPTTTNMNVLANALHVPPSDLNDPSQNLSLIKYVNSKLPNRQSTTTQVLHQYFTSQQQQVQSKYEVRTARNVNIFDDKLGNTNLSPSHSRTHRYSQALRPTETTYPQQNRFYYQPSSISQPSTSLLPKAVLATSNTTALDAASRTKSANTMARQRTGDSEEKIPSNITSKGSLKPVGNHLESIYDSSAYEQIKRFNLNRTLSYRNILPSILK